MSLIVFLTFKNYFKIELKIQIGELIKGLVNSIDPNQQGNIGNYGQQRLIVSRQEFNSLRQFNFKNAQLRQ